MNNILALAPLLIITIGGLFILLLDVFLKKDNKDYLGYISVFFLIGCSFVCFLFWNTNKSYFNGSLILDNFSLFFSLLLIAATFLVILISMKYISLQNSNHGEYYALLLFAFAGILIMLSTTDFIIIFLGLEVLSISSYVLAGLKRNDTKSSEAAVKYFLLGSFASAFIVYGIALLYGAFQSTNILSISSGFSSSPQPGVMAIVGFGFVIIGFGFKIAVVPFHMWTPDVYQGAPTPITAFFSVAPKVVGFAVLLRLLIPYFKSALESEAIFSILWVISALTMVIGNLAALRQTNVKRILAYSSIAHAGYMLVAVLAQDAVSLGYYLTVYLFMNIGAFSAVIALNKKNKEYVELEEYSGIGFKYPWIGVTFSIFLFSLAGFPPTGGFLAKFYVFSTAVRKGLTTLVIIAVLASLISVFYYLRIIIHMYMKEPTLDVSIHTKNPALFLVLFICLVEVIQLGIFPGSILSFIKEALTTMSLF